MKVCFILATGPSQNQTDIDLIRGKGTVYAVNNAIFMAPWADVHYACDEYWWKTYSPRRPEWFHGERLTISPYYYRHQCKRIPSEHDPKAQGFGRTAIRTGHNSGFQALNLAIIRRFKTICLSGFDHQHTNDKRHCHDDHPPGMGNAGAVNLWINAMNAAARDTYGAKVINCTRETALECFERMTLEDFISEYCNSDGVHSKA